MFDIDLMNRPGLQKIISKLHIDANSQKQKIIFENLDSNKKSSDSRIEKSNSAESNSGTAPAKVILV